MEFTSTVLYEERLTYYNVSSQDGEHFRARLLNAGDESHTVPPREVLLTRTGEAITSDADEDLVYFLRFDIFQNLRREFATSR